MNSASLPRDARSPGPTSAGRWPSFASHAADVGYSVTRLVEQHTDAKLTDPFDALRWRGKLLLLTDHGRRMARPACESTVERARSFVAQQPGSLRKRYARGLDVLEGEAPPQFVYDFLEGCALTGQSSRQRSRAHR